MQEGRALGYQGLEELAHQLAALWGRVRIISGSGAVVPAKGKAQESFSISNGGNIVISSSSSNNHGDVIA